MKTAFIIIGARGFIGSAFSNYLRAKGKEVIDIFRGQLTGTNSDIQYIPGFNPSAGKEYIIFDFAYTSVPNTSFNDPVRDFSENLRNVICHLEFVRLLPKASYIYISSGGTVYGNPAAAVPITEDHVNFPVAPYGITKLACEKYVQMYHEVHGVDVKIVRPSNIYGPGQIPFRGQGLVSTAIAKVMESKPVQIFGDGMQVRDYLYIDDFMPILLDIVRYGGNQRIFNTGSGVGYTIKEILETIHSVIGVSPVIEYLPFRPFDVHYNVLNSDAVSSLNNWSPKVSLEDGVIATLEWIKQQRR